MSKPIKRNREKINRINFLNLGDGVYLNEVSVGQLHLMREQDAVVGGKEYVYEGKLNAGEITFIGGADLKTTLVERDGFNHGYTLEGVAKEIFTGDAALNIYNPVEHRTFVYTNSSAALTFVGDPEKEYRLFVRFYENTYGDNNNRWGVIYGEAL